MPRKEEVSAVNKTVKKQRVFNKKTFFLTLLTIILLSAVGAAVYFYRQTTSLRKNPQEVAVRELKDTIEKISRLILLPEGEMPTMATVYDPEQLKKQTFFRGAEKGDKVLIYSKARQAVLYRPSTNMIINFAPVNLGNVESENGAKIPVNGNIPAAGN